MRDRLVVGLALSLLTAVGCGGNNEPTGLDGGSDHPADDGATLPDGSVSDSLPTNDGSSPPQNISSLGTNLDGLADWSSVYPFVDAFKMARAFISGSSSQWDDGRPLALDADGWVTKLENDQLARTLVFTALDGHYPSGRSVVLSEGERTIE